MSDKLNNVTPKWYKKMKVWQVVFLVITPMAAGGEAAIYIMQAHPAFHGVVVLSGVTLGVLKYLIKDENNDGLVD